MDLTEAEYIKKRWQEYTEEVYKKDLYDPENLNGVITNLEPNILECEVKWALGSITINKAAAAKSLQSCPTLCDPIDGSHQAPLSLGFSRQEYWSGLPLPSPMHESEK